MALLGLLNPLVRTGETLASFWETTFSLDSFHPHESQIIDSFHVSFYSALTKIILILSSRCCRINPAAAGTAEGSFYSSGWLVYRVQKKRKTVDYVVNTPKEIII